jgi:hypothetical protein
MKKLLKDIFTEKDNSTFCMAKVLWCAGVVSLITLSYIAVLHGKDYSPSEYGTGLGAALGGGGLGVILKGKTESPDGPSQ